MKALEVYEVAKRVFENNDTKTRNLCKVIMVTGAKSSRIYCHFPRAHHSGFSPGYYCGDAVDIASIELSSVAREAIRCSPMVSRFQLSYDLAVSLFSRQRRKLHRQTCGKLSGRFESLLRGKQWILLLFPKPSPF